MMPPEIDFFSYIVHGSLKSIKGVAWRRLTPSSIFGAPSPSLDSF